jgi:hypothetical protein
MTAISSSVCELLLLSKKMYSCYEKVLWLSVTFFVFVCRAFHFQEGDHGCRSAVSKAIDKAFNKGIGFVLLMQMVKPI